MGYFLGKDTLAVPSAQTLNPGDATLSPTGGATGGREGDNAGGGGSGSSGNAERDALVARCKTKCGGFVEPCFSQCLYQAGGGGGGGGITTCVEGKSCVSDGDCPGGKCERPPSTPGRLYAGKCKCGGGTPDPSCPEGKGATYEGCPCGRGYATLTGSCPTGYKFISRDPNNWDATDIPVKPGAKGTCECQKAIDDWAANKKGELGEYAPPAGLEDLMTMLLGRTKSLYGYDPKAIEAMFGRGFENVRGQEVGQRERLNRTLQSQGMLGTGTAVEQGNDLGFGTETAINNLARDIMIKNEEQKRADTELSSSILGRGLGFEQLIEAINAGRRGEGQNALSMLLALLQLFKG